MTAHLQDILWVTGVLGVALAFLWYAREGRKDDDRALALVAGALASACVLSAFAYVWWRW